MKAPHHAPMDHNASAHKKVEKIHTGTDDNLLERIYIQNSHYYNDMTHRIHIRCRSEKTYRSLPSFQKNYKAY